MNVVDLRVYRDPAFTPVVIFIDPQQEYVAEGRALGLANAVRAVENCRTLLAFARREGFPVAFTRLRQRGKFFGGHAHSGWIDGLSPQGGDMVFDRSLPSCYADREFADMMDNGGGDNAVLAGFTGTIACLSTAIDAYQRQHRVAFIADASASHALPSFQDDAAHAFVTEVIGLYGPVTTTERWMNEQTTTRVRKIGVVHE